jgi:phage N-6-adenine-methyltransferase
MINHETHFSSATPEWGTPQDFFDALDKEFGGFLLDVCATDDNAKCKKYYTVNSDGLAQAWSKRNWMNPPYGRTITAWIKRADDEAEKGNTTVALLPARTDTKYFHTHIYGKHEIRFVRGRLKFEGAQVGSGAAPFPSMVVIFRPPTKH